MSNENMGTIERLATGALGDAAGRRTLDMLSIAPALLADRGDDDRDIDYIFHLNWLEFVRLELP